VHAALSAVRAAGFPSWSLDLISGLPRLTEQLWLSSLQQAVAAGPDHISVYDLQVWLWLWGCVLMECSRAVCFTSQSKPTSSRCLPAAPASCLLYPNLPKVEAGTPFARWYSGPESPLPHEPEAARMFELATATLTAAGYEHYEVLRGLEGVTRVGGLIWVETRQPGSGQRCGQHILPPHLPCPLDCC
jgi:oxygen-independent coproporphyrinogen-3 oxidase